MDKTKVFKKLFKKKYINSISELHNLYYDSEKGKKKHIGYSFDCKCSPTCTLDIRVDLQGNSDENIDNIDKGVNNG